jgi:hypothetical protein
MKLKALTLTEDGTGGAMPETITVEMTAREMVLLAYTLSAQSDDVADSLLEGASVEGREIYSCLTGDVANRFFENGIIDMARVVAQ